MCVISVRDGCSVLLRLGMCWLCLVLLPGCVFVCVRLRDVLFVDVVRLDCVFAVWLGGV